MTEKVRSDKRWVVYSRLTPSARTRIGVAYGYDLTAAWENTRLRFPEWPYRLEVVAEE